MASSIERAHGPKRVTAWVDRTVQKDASLRGRPLTIDKEICAKLFAMKRVWKLCTRDIDGFDRRQGYALAVSADEARSLAGSPQGLHVFEKHPAMIWPGPQSSLVAWSN